MREQSRHFRLGVIGAMSVAWVLASTAASKAVTLTAPIVTTTGTYQGLMNFQELPGDPATGVNAFLGIRYGQAPLGTLRWQPPQAPNPGQGSMVAAIPGHSCTQGRATDSEDCLFLNVYTPSNANKHSRLPVFVWIHGGALVSGAGSDYDPSVMVADNDIIVVTINYRLGSLGFLAASVLAAAQPNAFQNVGDAGNYGLMDQQFALAWVQHNIAAFGGDADAVTIGGESAGGLSVSSQLASTNTVRSLTGRPLFRGAIIESGAYMYHDLPSLATYQTLSNSFAQKDCGGTATLACLQGLTAAQVFANEGVFGGFGIAPNFGTKILPRDLHTAFSTGQFNQVPVLQGTNANEGRLFEPGFFPAALVFPGVSTANIVAAGGPASFGLQVPNGLCATPPVTGQPAHCTYAQEIGFFMQTLVTATPSNNGPTAPFTQAVVAASIAAAGEYPIANFHNSVPQTTGTIPGLSNNFLGGDVDEALSQIFTDFVFACNGLDSNSDLSKHVPVFAYEFNDPNAPSTPGVPGPGTNRSGFTTASQHAAELQYLFNFGSNFTSAQAALATDMKTYWANFVKTGDPNSRGNEIFVSFKPTRDQLPHWTHFNEGNQKIQSLTPPGLLTPRGPHPFDTFTSEHFCATWQPLLTFNNGNEPQQP
ncbi:carboxylesterase/lipase family protein [Bradyrhizobium erythrophlei]|jgi:para-nitrobenzyl esterase|uniref:Carboxylic ester hydrolase n=1 Tax=Bradyrhizobium erythrophlei TaxID=1437360 RepID=A0A1M7TIZ9_9BRAD|nr:carboxylesterase family protein [Bradyrhizobium erythrophlei]SHN70666.1 Carboxylesterase family protein [Bradyrhizobium erythrophlei]